MRNCGKDPSSCSTKFLKERLSMVTCKRRNKNKKKQSNCIIMSDQQKNIDQDLSLSHSLVSYVYDCVSIYGFGKV